MQLLDIKHIIKLSVIHYMLLGFINNQLLN